MSTKYLLTLLRIALGGVFFYAGLTKIADPEWSAAFYLKGATTFSGFYTWLLDPSILPYVNFLNKWGLALIGLSLLIGLFVRWSAILGAVMMVLYYFPELSFPYVGEHSFLVDEHIVYAVALLFLAAADAGRHLGLDGRMRMRH